MVSFKMERTLNKNSPTELEYGLPSTVKFCKKCVMSNARPSSCNEYFHTSAKKHDYMQFDAEGVCSACNFNEAKYKKIDWHEREQELIDLLDKYRSKDGSHYDVLVPGSGGKDSAFAAHILKYKYGMHPLTVTWSPHIYTDIGFQNFQNWCHQGGFDNFLYTPNGKIHRLLTRNAFVNLLHPFQPFILGQKTFAVKMAAHFNIPLIFYGESPGEYGAQVSINQKKFSTSQTKHQGEQDDGFRLDFIDPSYKIDEIYLGGKSVSEYVSEGIDLVELTSYLPLDSHIIHEKKIEFHYLGYYLKWIPQECYYYAVKNTGFRPNPERTEGTYSKYNSIDDKIDGFYYYTYYIKFGYGRATQDASQEIRNHHLTREEGCALVKKFDAEIPLKYFKEFLNYISMTEESFHETCDQFRSPHLWKKINDQWKLRYAVHETPNSL